MMLWTITLIAIPVLSVFLFQYIISSPWHCQGLCCFNQAKCTSIPINGLYESQFEPVVNAFQRSLTTGWDIGASLFVMVDNKPMVDVAGGFKDKKKTQVYDTSTLNVIFSSGKVMETIAIAILVDKGLIDYDAPIATYWPEYGQNQKHDITMKDVLSHRSGSSYDFHETPTLDILQSLTKRDDFVASQTYRYPRGTIAYRSWSSAFISDAVCRRVDPQKRTLSSFVRDELFDKLGETFISPLDLVHGKEGRKHVSHFSEVHDVSLSTLLLGLLPQCFVPDIYSKLLPDGHFIKVGVSEALLFQSGILQQKHKDGYSFFDRPNLPELEKGGARVFNNRANFLSYEMMSGNHISNARALAKALDSFMKGDVVGEDTLAAFMTLLPPGYDRYLAMNITHTNGGWMSTPHPLVPVKDAECFGWFGVGGSTILHCTIGGRKVTISFVMNAMSPTFNIGRTVILLEELTSILLSSKADVP